MKTKTTLGIQCKFWVVLIRHDARGISQEPVLVAKFVAKGDAVAYAIHRAHALSPQEQTNVVFEVRDGIHTFYRAG